MLKMSAFMVKWMHSLEKIKSVNSERKNAMSLSSQILQVEVLIYPM
jgi:hypothetical protein